MLLQSEHNVSTGFIQVTPTNEISIKYAELY
jgi:hypothetical protein